MSYIVSQPNTYADKYEPHSHIHHWQQVLRSFFFKAHTTTIHPTAAVREKDEDMNSLNHI